jgi:hypothetical protein
MLISRYRLNIDRVNESYSNNGDSSRIYHRGRFVTGSVKGIGLRFRLSFLHDPQLSMNNAHIQWVMSVQQTMFRGAS